MNRMCQCVRDELVRLGYNDENGYDLSECPEDSVEHMITVLHPAVNQLHEDIISSFASGSEDLATDLRANFQRKAEDAHKGCLKKINDQ